MKENTHRAVKNNTIRKSNATRNVTLCVGILKHM